MVAFDFESQRWLEGKEAAECLARQCRETLDILAGDSGREYARFVGKDYAAMVEETLIALADAKAELAGV